MMNRLLRILAMPAALALFSSAACSGADDGAGPEDSRTGSVEEPLISPGFNVTQGITPNSRSETETDAVTLGTTGYAVAYNSTDTGHISGSNFCKGFSESAISYQTNGAFRALRFFPTPDVALLQGDPSITYRDFDANNWFVYVSSLALSTSKWNTLPKQAGGCISPSVYSAAHPDLVCVNAVVLPKNGAPAAFPTQITCVGGGGDVLDGGSIYYSVTTSNLYVTYWNVTRGRADVFRNGAQIASPNVAVYGHPFFTKNARNHFSNTDFPTLIAPDTAGKFWVSRLNETTATWTTIWLVSSDFLWDQPITLNGGKQLRQRGYAADLYDFGVDYLTFFYSKPPSRGATTKRLQGVTCTFTGVTGSCAAPSSAITSGNGYLPVVQTVNINGGSTPWLGGTNRTWLSYWTDTTPAGSIQLIAARLEANGSLTSFPMSGTTQKPCTSDDYWGDYDGMSVANNGSASPLLLRYATDSTAKACTGNDPEHISVVFANGAQ